VEEISRGGLILGFKTNIRLSAYPKQAMRMKTRVFVSVHRTLCPFSQMAEGLLRHLAVRTCFERR